jgi:hypothetical protein
MFHRQCKESEASLGARVPERYVVDSHCTRSAGLSAANNEGTTKMPKFPSCSECSSRSRLSWTTFRNDKVVIIEGVGHFPMLEKPDEFKEILREVMKKFSPDK